MEEYGDGNVFTYRQPKPINVELDIINDKKIDPYTMGIYVYVKYIIENNLPHDWLASKGSEEYLNRALKKLIENGYIRGEE